MSIRDENQMNKQSFTSLPRKPKNMNISVNQLGESINVDDDINHINDSIDAG